MRIAALVVLLAVAGSAEAAPVRSASFLAVDAESGAELAARAPDDVRPIASLTKLFVAVALRRRGLDLEAWTTITRDDVNASEGGAWSALRVGQTYRNLDLLHAMLLVSDNRVPSALARSLGLSGDDLLAELRDLAKDLDLEHTEFADATGILTNNSTARDLAAILRTALADPVLARILRTRIARITSKSEASTITYKSTVQPLWTDPRRTLAGKTGHTEDAGYCLVIRTKLGSRVVDMVFLGAPSYQSRFADFRRLSASLSR